MKQKIEEKSPEMRGDKVFLSGGHQVVLIVKGNGSWDEYYKKYCKRNDDSWKKDGEILEQFEKDNDIEFLYCKSSEEISFWDVNPSIWKRIKMFFMRFLSIEAEVS